MSEEYKASILTIISNSILFALKISVGILFNSIAIISDALNSLLDIISSSIVHYSIKVSKMKPDKRHQFGHSRSQPVAGLTIAIFTSVFGIQILFSSIKRLISNETLKLGYLPIIIMGLVIIVKAALYIHTKIIIKKTNSLALKASCVDHRNDVFASSIVLVGLLMSNFGFPIFDSIAGILVSLYIIYSGYELGKENIKYIMGEAPSEEIFKKIEKSAMKVKGVIGLNDIRAHLLGTVVECEVHIYVDKHMTVMKSHDIGNKVKEEIQKISDIQSAFIHIDPYKGEMINKRKF